MIRECFLQFIHIFMTIYSNIQKVIPSYIFVENYQRTYCDNSKYIIEELLKQNVDCKIFLVVTKEIFKHPEKVQIPSMVTLVCEKSFSYVKYFARSHILIDNALCIGFHKFPIKQNQIYLNTWHGSLGIKRLSGNNNWEKIANWCNKKISYFITDSVFEENVFSSSFFPDVPVWKFGHPRNDIFFSDEKMKSASQKVRDHFHINPDVKIALYAPTFRDNKSDVSALQLDTARLKKTCESTFGGEWVVMTRLHFHNARRPELAKTLSGEHIVNANEYPDMQELLAAADLGITDFSSWIFDYLFTGRPAFLYARDIEQYENDRGFYYPLTETPFSIANSDDELTDNIMAFDYSQYKKKVEVFLQEKGCYEKGNACERVVKEIVHILEDNNESASD